MEPWYRVAVIIIKPLLLVFFRRDFRGQEHVPARGGCIVVTNHISYADPFPTALFVHDRGRRPRFLAKSSLFRLPFAGRVLRGAKQIPVFRNSADAAAALSAAEAAIRAGECVVIYPEGTVTRDPDYWPMVSKTGVARLALATGAPVVPVAQWGTQRFLGRSPRPRPLPRKRVQMLGGPPIDLSAWHDAKPDGATLRAITDHVMARVTALLAELRDEPAPGAPFVPPGRTAALQSDDDTRRSA